VTLTVPPTTNEAITFVVYGRPAPQGSKRAFTHPRTGKAMLIEQVQANIKLWRDDVRNVAQGWLDHCGPRDLLCGPLAVTMVFSAARPKNHYRTGRNAHLLRDSAPTRPASTPDLSKLARSTEDALTGVIWKDDAQIVEYRRLAKVYVGEDPLALDRPGAQIVITPLV